MLLDVDGNRGKGAEDTFGAITDSAVYSQRNTNYRVHTRNLLIPVLRSLLYVYISNAFNATGAKLETWWKDYPCPLIL